MPDVRVAFQGALGAYSEEAVTALWPRAEPVPMHAVEDVAAAVEAGAVDFGVLPVENTLAGAVVATDDALARHAGLVVLAETVVPIHHCVLALPGASINGLAFVESHPVALAQCTAFFRANPRLSARAAFDTAGAAREVAGRGDLTIAAIAGRAAAARYGLAILAADIEDRPDNQTRFLAVARSGAPAPDAPPAPEAGAPARTSFLLTTANAPRALFEVLRPIAEAGLNMSRLEARPTGEPWTYRFALDIAHAADEPAVAAVAEVLRGVTRTFRVLGTWRRATP